MALFYQRIIEKIHKDSSSLRQTADILNDFGKEKGLELYIKPQNVDIWLKGSIPSNDFAKVIEMYLYDNLSAKDLLEILNIEENLK